MSENLSPTGFIPHGAGRLPVDLVVVLSDKRLDDLNLSGNQKKLYKLLAAKPTRVFPSDELLKEFESADVFFDTSYIPGYIRELRRIFGYNFISSIRGRGYTLTSNETVLEAHRKSLAGEADSLPIPYVQTPTAEGILTLFTDRNLALSPLPAKNARVDLSRVEADYLQMFMSQPYRTYPIEVLDRFGTRSVDKPTTSNVTAATIYKLRAKLGASLQTGFICNNRDKGYSLLPVRSRPAARRKVVFQR